MEITITEGDNRFSTRQKNIYNSKEFSDYNIKISDKRLMITGKNNLNIKYNIEDNNIDSVKIHSTKNSLTVWDYKKKKRRIKNI